MTARVWLSLAHMSGQEHKYIQQAFDTHLVVQLGLNMDGFERDLEGFLGLEQGGGALSAGTAAIHLA